MPGLKFRILFDSLTEEEVFRDILIDEATDFETFYKSILEAFSFSNDQMASFFVSDHDWTKGKEIALMDLSDDTDDPVEMMSSAVLRHFIESPRQRFILVYDFFNMWIFLIELQDIVSETPEEPKLIFSVGHIPDELKEKGNQSIENMTFETDVKKGMDDFDLGDFDDDFSEEGFENIDDFDL